MEKTVETFKGSDNQYVVFATRGKEKLGISPLIGFSPAGALLVVRFVVISPEASEVVQGAFKEFQHFKPRGMGKFHQGEEVVLGMRLNRLMIPVFAPPPPPMVFLQMAKDYLVWEMFADWANERAKNDGFKPLYESEELKTILLNAATGQSPDLDTTQYKLVMEFPDFQKAEGEEEK